MTEFVGSMLLQPGHQCVSLAAWSRDEVCQEMARIYGRLLPELEPVAVAVSPLAPTPPQSYWLMRVGDQVIICRGSLRPRVVKTTI